MTRLLTILIFAFLISCNTTQVQPQYEIESELITFSETVPQASIFAQFKELSSGHIFLAKLTPSQKEQLYKGWKGTLLLNEGEGYLIVMGVRP